MDRRSYLAGACTALGFGLAGCLADTGGSEEPTTTPTPDELVDHLAAFREQLESEGLDVEAVTVEDGIVSIDHLVDPDGLRGDVVAATGAFADRVAAGWGVEWLEGWARDPETDDLHADYTVLDEWATAWRAGDLSDDELFERAGVPADLAE